MVVMHHHHAVRGMEWYRGKPIMRLNGRIVVGHAVSIVGFDTLRVVEK